jgi:hypothetical protein
MCPYEFNCPTIRQDHELGISVGLSQYTLHKRGTISDVVCFAALLSPLPGGLSEQQLCPVHAVKHNPFMPQRRSAHRR